MPFPATSAPPTAAAPAPVATPAPPAQNKAGAEAFDAHAPSRDTEARTSAAVATQAERHDRSRRVARPLAGLLDALAEAPERWSWQRSPGRVVAIDDDVRRWLAALDEAVAAARRPASNVTAGSGNARLETSPREVAADELRLFRDGRPAVVIRIGPTGLEVDAELDAMRPFAGTAPLGATDVARLRAILPRSPS